MDSKELQLIIKCGETSTVQFKERFPNQDSIASEMVAISNASGGMILFGIKDKTGGMPFMKANLHNIQAGQGFNSIGKLEISEVALEEILQNALVHRDYTRNAPI